MRESARLAIVFAVMIAATAVCTVLAQSPAPPVCWKAGAAETCVPLETVQRVFAGFADGQLSALEQSQVDALKAKNDLSVSREALAECQATLGPLEFQARQQQQQTAVGALRANYEQDHPGWTLDDQGRPVKKSGENQASEPKSDKGAAASSSPSEPGR